LSALQLKIMVALGGLVVVVVGLVGGVAERGLHQRETERLERALEQRASLIREVLGGASLESRQFVRLDGLADRLGEVTGHRVTLITRDGEVVGDSEVPAISLTGLENHADRPEVVEALAGKVGTDRRYSQTLKRPLIYVALPAKEMLGIHGVIRVAMGTDSAEQAVSELRRELMVAAALGLGAAVLLSYIIAWWITRTIGRLRDGVQALAHGEVDKRLPWAPGGELGEIVESINQMAERLKAQLGDATAEKQKLTAVLGSMAEGVLVADTDGRTVLANPRFREFFSAWGEVEGRSVLEVVRHPDLDAVLAEALSETHEVAREISIPGTEVRRVMVYAVAFPPEGPREGVVAVFHDISEIRHLEEVRRDFIANASHELRTPITSIRGFAETLVAGAAGGGESSAHLDVILRNAERLSNLVDDLLELSRIEGQNVPFRPAELDLAAMLKAHLVDLAPRVKEAELQTRLEIRAEVIALADREATDRVIMNLIDNAIKYSNPGGMIELALWREGRRAFVEVRDQGIGIPEPDQTRIFERFYRVDLARSRSLGGTGLGLAIVRHLVQGMGGEVHVRSEPGRGAAFRFSLPMADSAN